MKTEVKVALIPVVGAVVLALLTWWLNGHPSQVPQTKPVVEQVVKKDFVQSEPGRVINIHDNGKSIYMEKGDRVNINQ